MEEGGGEKKKKRSRLKPFFLLVLWNELRNLFLWLICFYQLVAKCDWPPSSDPPPVVACQWLSPDNRLYEIRKGKKIIKFKDLPLNVIHDSEGTGIIDKKRELCGCNWAAVKLSGCFRSVIVRANVSKAQHHSLLPAIPPRLFWLSKATFLALCAWCTGADSRLLQSARTAAKLICAVEVPLWAVLPQSKYCRNFTLLRVSAGASHGCTCCYTHRSCSGDIHDSHQNGPSWGHINPW